MGFMMLMVLLVPTMTTIDSKAFDHLQRLPGGVHVDGSEVLGQGEVAELTLDVIVRLHS